MSAPRVFSIPAGARFLPSFVAALRSGGIVPGLSQADGPLALADATIFVPTRRAARALLTEFAQAEESGATLLPKIRPLGAVDEDAEMFGAPQEEAFGFDPDIPDAIGELPRRFVLAQLVHKWAQGLRGAIVGVGADGALVTDEQRPLLVGATPTDAIALAGDLGRLIDEFIIEGAEWSDVSRLDVENNDRYWGVTAEFLKIAIAAWPGIREKLGLLDAAERRARLIDREIERLRVAQRDEPMIVLGSTGTNKATARLMRAIARMPRGAVVLPGLDCGMDETDWRIVAGKGESIQPAWGHPQAMLARLLGILECGRADIVEIGARSATVARRMAFASQALVPEESTAKWRPWRERHDGEIADALSGVSLIEAPDENIEALAIAVRLRAVLEEKDRVAALVTPDRSIARRVQAELRRWNIDIDDSGGEPLGQTAAGGLARAALAAALEDSDVALMRLLARPEVAPAQDRSRTEKLARALEIGVLRAMPHDPDLRRRIAAARQAAADYHAHPAVRRIADADWRDMDALADAIESALAPMRIDAPMSIPDLARAHRECIEALGANASVPAGDDRQALDALLAELESAGAASTANFALSLDDYARLFDHLCAGIVVRGPQRSHARLKILGPLEARLIDVDTLVLAGLDENVWPPQPKSDAFLNRPMRQQIGLTPPERRIGQSAHDFWMGFGAPDVVLTRAAKRGGSPTVPSRLLQRMAALADADFDSARARGAEWLELARTLDAGEQSKPLARPHPKPPLDLRPEALSVTKIETLRRDPYAIYADCILELKAVGALDDEPGPAEQGSAVHDALHLLASEWPDDNFPVDALDRLEARARENLAGFFADPAWEAFQWPRIRAGLAYVIDYERKRRPDLLSVHGEASGRLEIPLTDGSVFRLSARADRIEVDRSSRARVVDYKTGQAPTLPQILAGLNTQITIESYMIARDAFEGIAATPDSAIYMKVGGAEGGKIVKVGSKDKPFDDIVRDHWSELVKMLEAWRDPARGYASRPVVQYALRYSDYDHLARVKEWSASGGESDE
ncbi:MAG: double-strand break repair protein AddB [Beijerinckiaceae bacterium]